MLELIRVSTKTGHVTFKEAPRQDLGIEGISIELDDSSVCAKSAARCSSCARLQVTRDAGLQRPALRTAVSSQTVLFSGKFLILLPHLRGTISGTTHQPQSHNISET